MLEMQEMWVPFQGWEDLLKEGMVSHSSILAWRFPWTEDPGGKQSMESQKVGHDWVAEHTRTRARCVSQVLPCLSSHRCWSLQCFCFHSKKGLQRICISATNVENEKKKLRKKLYSVVNIEVNYILSCSVTISVMLKLCQNSQGRF